MPELDDPLYSEVNVRRKDNKIYIYDVIDEKTQMVIMSLIDDFIRECAAKHENTVKLVGVIPEVLELHINSPGGDVFASFSIYDYLKRSPVQTIGYIDGRAFSGASIILCGCSHRIITENGFILCHQARSGVVGTAKNIEDTYQNISEVQNKMKALYLKETKIPKDVLDNMLKEDIYLDSKKCLEYGLVDEIFSFSDKRFEDKKPSKKKAKKKSLFKKKETEEKKENQETKVEK